MSELAASWVEGRVDDLGEVVSGGTPSRSNPAYWNGAIPWVTPSEITALKGKHLSETRERITAEGLAGSAARLLPVGSVVVTTRATLGEVAIAAVPLTTNQGFKSIVPNASTHSVFTYHLLRSMKGLMERMATGTTFLEVSKKDFVRLPLRRPSVEEQGRIAAVLDTMDAKIEETEAVIAKLKQIRNGLLHDLLTRDTESINPTPLQQVAAVRFSSVDKVSKPGEEPVRLCNYTDVYFGRYLTHHMEFMWATAATAEIERFGLHEGDVIITKDSETPDDIGIPAVVDSTAPDLVCGYHLALIRPNRDAVDPTFLAMQLSHHRLARYFGQQANGSTRYALSLAAVEKTPLFLPSKEAQMEAARIIRRHDQTVAQEERILTKFKALKEGLMADLLTGRVRVPET